MLLPSKFRYEYEALDPNSGNDHEEAIINAYSEGIVRANELQLLALQDYAPELIPHCIVCAGFEYRDPEACRVDVRRDGDTVYDPECQAILGAIPLLRAKRETCMGLACFHAALLRLGGDPTARAVVRHNGGRDFHMVVESDRYGRLDTAELVRAGVGHA